MILCINEPPSLGSERCNPVTACPESGVQSNFRGLRPSFIINNVPRNIWNKLCNVIGSVGGQTIVDFQALQALYSMRFEVLMVVKIWSPLFWLTTPCSLNILQCFMAENHNINTYSGSLLSPSKYMHSRQLIQCC
jgi:hypothetical protein